MKAVLLILFFGINLLKAQILPRFENDTLYTTSGFKIFKGQIITFAEGTGNNGRFRYLKIRGSDNPKWLTHHSLIVKRVWDFYTSGLDNAYIKIRGTINSAESSRSIRFKMIFEKAIAGSQGSTPEVVVPDQFRSKKPSENNNPDEIAKWYKLYRDGAITKEEFERQKKKLLEH